MTFNQAFFIRFAMLNLHADVFFGQQGFNHLRPLNEAEVAAVEIVLEADVVGFLQFFKMAKVGLFTSSVTPILWHRFLMSVVLPAPMEP